MNRLIKLFRSSTGTKAIVAVTGMVMLGFLVGHVAGNLKVFIPDVEGQPDIDRYAEFLRTIGEPMVPRNGLLWVARGVLLASVVLHIVCVIRLSSSSKAARPQGYAKSHARSASSAATICFVLLTSSLPVLSFAQEQSVGLISFNEDVRPILASKCLKCHGVKRANNDFRVDEEDSLLTYIEGGADADESMLWSDYLTTEDEDLHMPPPEQPQLTGTELATIKFWIEEGAVWEEPTSAEFGDAAGAASKKRKSFLGAAWSFQGLFHPAAVHFPLGLLSASTLFLLLSLRFGDNFRSAAFHCLWLGAIGGLGACVMGWSYAQHEGYGAFSFDVISNGIDLHRWIGILVTVLAIITIPLAKSAFAEPTNLVKQKRWLIASLLIGFAVGATGYLGGELSYGNNHYQKEFRHLFLIDREPSEDRTAQ